MATFKRLTEEAIKAITGLTDGPDRMNAYTPQA